MLHDAQIHTHLSLILTTRLVLSGSSYNTYNYGYDDDQYNNYEQADFDCYDDADYTNVNQVSVPLVYAFVLCVSMRPFVLSFANPLITTIHCFLLVHEIHGQNRNECLYVSRY